MRSVVCILQLCIFLTSENNDDREKLTRTEKVRMVLVFAAHHLIGKPNQDIPELFSLLSLKIAWTEKNWS